MIETTVLQHCGNLEPRKGCRPAKFWSHDEKVNMAAHRVLHQGVTLAMGKGKPARALSRERIAAMIMKTGRINRLPAEDYHEFIRLVHWLIAPGPRKIATHNHAPYTILPEGYAVLCRYGRSK